MTRTMFESQGFRPGAATLGYSTGSGGRMGNALTDAWKKYSQVFTNPTPQLTTPPVAKAPEPTIFGYPQNTVMWTGAAILGAGVLAALFFSQK